jgi:3-methyl-2-oxobutanoate hydroxymethyltransferase
MARKKTVLDFQRMRTEGRKIVFLTAYDHPTAMLEERAGVDMILVGDSVGMCLLGYDSTIPVTMDDMVRHTQAVRRGAPNTFVIADMPFMSYQVSVEEAVASAGRLIKETGADAVKLEGGRRVADHVRAINDAGMLVMGHLGLTPQSAGQLGGFKAQAKDAGMAMQIMADARAVEEAGAFSILIEAVPPPVTREISARAEVPILSIGAGGDCAGQLLIVSDLLGIFQAFTPKFVKKYADLADAMVEAFEAYGEDVRKGLFPEAQHTYSMDPGEEERMMEMLDAE